MIKFPHYQSNFSTISTISTIILFLPILVSSSTSNCLREAENEAQNTSEALKLKIVAVASILLASALGVSLPFLAKNSSYLNLNPENDIYFLIKAFAAGVILGTGFVHVLPDAFKSLTSPCLNEKPWRKFPFTGFVAMVSAIVTLMVEALATGYQKRSELRKAQPVVEDGDEERDAHGVVRFAERVDSSELIRHRIISQVLELAILVHSVIIGVSLGASQNPSIIKPLVAALGFHQFFEGLGLGGCISQAEFKVQTVAAMVVVFSVTTPAGVAIGIGISNVYDENSPTAIIVQGLLLSTSAGILIYMALVDLLAADFMNPKMLTNFKLQLGAKLSVLLGVGCMSLMAKWAES